MSLPEGEQAHGPYSVSATETVTASYPLSTFVNNRGEVAGFGVTEEATFTRTCCSPTPATVAKF